MSRILKIFFTRSPDKPEFTALYEAPPIAPITAPETIAVPKPPIAGNAARTAPAAKPPVAATTRPETVTAVIPMATFFTAFQSTFPSLSVIRFVVVHICRTTSERISAVLSET